jgi:hypothetical protein
MGACVLSHVFAGSLLLVQFMVSGHVFDHREGFTIELALKKTSYSFVATMTKGILCNWLVCIAVWQGNAAQDITGKLLGIWFPISAFVTMVRRSRSNAGSRDSSSSVRGIRWQQQQQRLAVAAVALHLQRAAAAGWVVGGGSQEVLQQSWPVLSWRAAAAVAVAMPQSVGCSSGVGGQLH